MISGHGKNLSPKKLIDRRMARWLVHFSKTRWVFEAPKPLWRSWCFQITSGNFASQWHETWGMVKFYYMKHPGWVVDPPLFYSYFWVGLRALSFSSQDFEVIRPILPKMKGTPEKPAYVPSATHLLPTFTAFNMTPGMICWGTVDGRNPAAVDK